MKRGLEIHDGGDCMEETGAIEVEQDVSTVL